MTPGVIANTRHIMRNGARTWGARALRRLVPGSTYMRVSLCVVNYLYRLGFHGLLVRAFGGADAPAWALYRRLYGGRP